MVIRYLFWMSVFMNRLFNRIPKNIKALTDGTENNDKKW